MKELEYNPFTPAVLIDRLVLLWLRNGGCDYRAHSRNLNCYVFIFCHVIVVAIGRLVDESAFLNPSHVVRIVYIGIRTRGNPPGAFEDINMPCCVVKMRAASPACREGDLNNVDTRLTGISDNID